MTDDDGEPTPADPLRRAAEQAVEFADCVPAEAVMGNAPAAAECWMHLKRLAKAWRAEEETRRATALRCGYVLGTCRGEDEMRAEARAILELLGETP